MYWIGRDHERQEEEDVLTPWFPLNLINGRDDRTYKRQIAVLLNNFHGKHIQRFNAGKFPDKTLEVLSVMKYLCKSFKDFNKRKSNAEVEIIAWKCYINI